MAIFPKNSPDMVESILSRLQNAPSGDQIVKTEILQEKSTPLGEFHYIHCVHTRSRDTDDNL